MIAINIIKKIENFYNAVPMLWAVKIISFFFGLRYFDRINKAPLKGYREKLLRAELRLGYESNFNRMQLKTAYVYRIKYFIAVYLGMITGDRKKAKLYLDIVSKPDFIDAINLTSELRDVLHALNGNSSALIEINFKNRMPIGRTLVCGPKLDIFRINFAQFDTLVFLKPPPEGLDTHNLRVVIILNNFWVKNRKNSILKWISNNPTSIVISPIDINSVYVRDPEFNNMPTSLLGVSPMGMQRAIIILEKKFNIQELMLDGFDFSLSRSPYNVSYSSAMSEIFGTQNKAIIHSNKGHDFVFNVLLTRELARNFIHIKGDVIKLSNKNIGELMNIFHSIYI
jgi:hypothetical protein